MDRSTMDWTRVLAGSLLVLVIGAGCRSPSDAGLDPAPSLNVTLTAQTLTVRQAWTGVVGVTVAAVGGSVADVSLSLEAPPGITGAFDPVTDTLTISVDSAVSAGSYQLTVRAQGTGAVDGTAALALHVETPIAAKFDLSRCSPGDHPMFAAYQDQPTAPWRVIPTSNGVVDLAIRGTRPSFAIMTARNAGVFARAWFTRDTELAGLLASMRCSSTPPPPGKAVQTTIANLPAGHLVAISLGPDGTGTILEGPVTLRFIPDGMLDLLAYAYPLNAGPSPDNRLFIRRDVNTVGLANGASIGDVDLTGPDSDVPEAVPFTVANLVAGEQYTHSMVYHTKDVGCSRHSLYSGRVSSSDSGFTAFGVPARRQRPTDRHGLTVFASAAPGLVRSVTTYTPGLVSARITLPAYLPEPTITVLGPAGRLRFQLVYPLPATDLLEIFARTGGGNRFQLVATRGYLGGDTVDVAFPDLSGLPGWNDAWLAGSGTPLWDLAAGREIALADRCETGSEQRSSRTNDTGGRAPER